MTHCTHSRTLEQTVAAIQALDLSLIKFKATRSEDGYGWSHAYADQMEVAYKRYLILNAKHPELMLAPEQDIDRFWHMHILDTRKYAADCEATFGYFLHHFPYLGLRGEGDEEVLQSAFEDMQRLYREEFGEDMIKVADSEKAAWCGASSAKTQAAWCGAAQPEAKAAWCGAAKPEAKAAWCGAAKPEAKAAWCGAAKPEAKAAWCGAAQPEAKAAWCGAAHPEAKAAWCGAAAVAEAVKAD